jgi:hypothetical protein
MGEKLVMHCKGPKKAAVKYNGYVVSKKLFCTFAIDIGKRNHYCSVCADY